MAIQILDSHVEIYFRIGDVVTLVAKEGMAIKEYNESSGSGVWITPEVGPAAFKINVADVNNPGNLTTSIELREYIDGLIENFIGQETGGGGSSFANVSAKASLAPSALSTELFPVRLKRVDVVLQNDTDQTADIRRGPTAAVSGSEAIRLLPGEQITIDYWEDSIQAVFTAAGTGLLIAEETYVV